MNSKLIKLFTLIVILTIPTQALAIGGRPAFPSLLTTALVLAPMFIGQIVLHESAHAFVANRYGVHTDIQLFPPSNGSGFRFGQTNFHGPFPSISSQTWTLLAPRILDVGIVLGIGALRYFVDLPNWLDAIAQAWQIAALGDFVYNGLNALGPNTDTSRINARIGPVGSLGLFATVPVMIAAGIYLTF